MAADVAPQSAEVEDDFLEESLSKPIFYSSEVEEAISQVSKSFRLCMKWSEVKCIFDVNGAL